MINSLWNDVESVSVISTTLKCLGALIGILILIYGLRESNLKSTVQAEEKAKWSQELDEAKDRANKALIKHQGRSLTTNQIESFVANTEKFPKGPVTIHVYYNSSESSEYARQTRNMLNKAGYQLGSHSGYQTALVPPKDVVYGQIIGVRDSANPPLFAGYLQKAFNDIGVSVEGSSGDFILSGEVWVFIGKKPE